MADPIQFEVIRNALGETTEEMSAALRRSAYSTNIKTRCDFSCAVFDREANVLAQAFAQANHLGSMVRLVPLALEEYGVDNLAPGDAIVMNDPYRGGVHLNDIFPHRPLLLRGRAVRLRRQPRPPRRRGRRGPGQRRRLPGGLPGGGHHPAP